MNAPDYSSDTSPVAIGRRGMLTRCGMGFGSLALTGLLENATSHSALGADALNPMAPKVAHFPSKVKHVIHHRLTHSIRNQNCSGVADRPFPTET